MFCTSENHYDDGDYHNRAPPVRDGTTRKKEKKEEEEEREKKEKWQVHITHTGLGVCLVPTICGVGWGRTCEGEMEGGQRSIGHGIGT